MLNSSFRVFGIGTDPSELDEFEPIYGLTRRSLDEWLSRNPELRKKYYIELAARLQRSRSVHTVRSPCNEWVRRLWRYLVHAACALRLLVRTTFVGGFGIDSRNSIRWHIKFEVPKSLQCRP